jgi:hypothetical protein
MPDHVPATEGSTLLPASQTTAAQALAAAAAARAAPTSERDQKREEEREADAVFAKLKSLKGPEDKGSE